MFGSKGKAVSVEHRVNARMHNHMTDKKLIASSAAKYMKTALFWAVTQQIDEIHLLTFRENLSVLF
jgi:hypothetical protein